MFTLSITNLACQTSVPECILKFLSFSLQKKNPSSMLGLYCEYMLKRDCISERRYSCYESLEISEWPPKEVDSISDKVAVELCFSSSSVQFQMNCVLESPAFFIQHVPISKENFVFGALH